MFDEIRFINKSQLSTSVWQFFFTKPANYAYLSGQYADFVISPGDQRTMTLVSHPSEAQLSFATRILKNPSQFKSKLAKLNPGETIKIGQALGDVILPKNQTSLLVMVGSGIGATSFVSMTKELVRLGSNQPLRLLLASRHASESIFDETFQGYGHAKIDYFVAPKAIEAADIIATTAGRADFQIYLSGSEQFVMKLRRQLLELGLNDSQIVFDYFTGYQGLWL